ncbi:MAG: CDP-glycerol glycerophosphotransferase family protein [Clostridia bacterium]|nr:CDP-glycerol glycerophosphotransferase family protein [Clostridia bacterium]
MNVKVSVIVAVNNAESNIRASLDSIKSQTLKDIEVLLIDASSVDSTAEIMKEYCMDSRFRYIKTDTDSISFARNKGIEEARGKYIAFGDANVIFTKNVIEGMYECAEKENADLCLAPMASSDVYGKHEFTSSDILSHRKKTDKFDTDLIWNPAVTNKLFLKSKITEAGLFFNRYGKAREAAFSIPFAFCSDVIVSSSKGAVIYVIPVSDDGVSEFLIEHYLDAYEFIIEKAEAAFNKAIEESITDFDRKELKKLAVCYKDQVYHKEITVLLYSYYRHFWSLEDKEIKKYADIIMKLYSLLSKSGKKAVRKKNKDIFYGERLIDSREEMAENPKVTVGVGLGIKDINARKERIDVQIESIFMQTMPSFELFVDSRLYDIFPEKWKNCENVTFIETESLGDFKDSVLHNSNTEYIMFQDGFARLNPKILMRHYCAFEGKDKYGFSTSPLTCFDGKTTKEYIFSSLFFENDLKQTRVAEEKFFVLDLFFSNKLFRKEHLLGIHFNFTDNPVSDMYNLYLHSRFRKISHRGSYLPYTEEEAIEYVKSMQTSMFSESRKVFAKYKRIYFIKFKVNKLSKRVNKSLRRAEKKIINWLGVLLATIYSKKKLQNRAFFYTTRADKIPLENLSQVYYSYKGEKVLFAKRYPHTLKDNAEIRKYIMTSKVIVTDDYINLLKKVRLRENQKVIQLWYAGGAIRRFGLDSPDKDSRIDEYKAHSQYTDVCVSSEYVRQFYSHAFGVEMDVVKALGNPRTDLIVDEEKLRESRENICSKHPLLKEKKHIYVYLPTNREYDDETAVFDPKLDWNELNDVLDDDEIFILCRHPNMKHEYIKGMLYPRVKDYTTDSAMELLSVADVVITDYSAIMFDSTIMDIPMVFYCPDYDTYDCDFYLNYERDVPGEIIKNPDELLEAARRAKDNGYKESIKAFKEMEMGACDGNSTERVCKLIESYIK